MSEALRCGLNANDVQICASRRASSTVGSAFGCGSFAPSPGLSPSAAATPANARASARDRALRVSLFIWFELPKSVSRLRPTRALSVEAADPAENERCDEQH